MRVTQQMRGQLVASVVRLMREFGDMADTGYRTRMRADGRGVTVWRNGAEVYTVLARV